MKRYLFPIGQSLFALALGLLAGGCNTDTPDTLLPDQGTSTITLRLPQAETRTTDAEYKAAEEKINQLRIIIFSQDKPIINASFTEADLSSGTVTIEGVPVGNVDIYAIANEQSLGQDYTDLTTFVYEEVNGVKKAYIEDLERTHFPKRFTEKEVAQYGLPMSWFQRDLPILQPDTTPQVIEVELERCVAKLNIIMSNTLSSPITINSMSFGTFFGDRLYLFHERALDIPDGTQYAAQIYDSVTIQIDPYSNKTLACYIYPSYAWKDISQSTPYTIGFTTTTATYNPVAFITQYGGALNSIPRNTQVNIYATLSAESNLDVKFDVTDWDTPVEIPVPPFN